MNHSRIGMLIVIILSVVIQVNGQVSWKRDKPQETVPLQLFHSPHSINLPTAETLQRGDLEFEISHRFLPTLKDGYKSLFGFDGPVNIRLALGYAVTDDLVLTLGRSNIDDNLELKSKYKLFQYSNDFLPLVVAVTGGIAWNTEPIGRSAADNRNYQYFGQVVFNTLINKKVGIGFVPSYLYNSNIYRSDTRYSITTGFNLQYYVSDLLSIMAEFNPTFWGYRNRYDTSALGIELETGGHFFKIVLTNNSRLNTSQFLAGADKEFDKGEWMIGFNITRLLKF